MGRGAIGVEAKIFERMRAVNSAAKKGAFRSLSHAAASIRKAAIESMIFAPKASRPGTPPHAHQGKLRRSIRYSVDETNVTVGPSYSAIRRGGRPPWLGSMHERGGTFRGKKKGTKRYIPARPFMAPALAAASKRFKASWKSSIS
jgi:phage gpG-like protein